MSACVASRVSLIRGPNPSTPGGFARRVPVPVPRAARVRVRAQLELFGGDDAGKPDEKVIIEPRYVPVTRALTSSASSRESYASNRRAERFGGVAKLRRARDDDGG